MARASWKGFLRIGNVTLPVRLYGATRSVAPRFIQLHAIDHAPVRRVTVCAQDGEEVSDGDIIRAAEYDGKYIELTEEEIEGQTGFERDIVIRQITDAGVIDPLYYDTPYYLIPDKGGELSYAIFRRAFEKTAKVAIATLLFYGRERLAAISSHDGMMYAQTLRFQDEIVPKSDMRSPSLPQPSPAHVSIASRVLEHYDLPFYPGDYRSQQLDLLNELIERKAKGLPAKKREQISYGTTPEGEVMTEMKAMLEESPKTLG